MIAALITAFWPYIAGAVAFVAGVLGLYAKGRSDAKAKAVAKDAKDALATHERINNAPITDSPDDARRWLDSHSKRLRRGRKP